MKKNYVTPLIVILVLIIMFAPVVSEMISNSSMNTIKYDEFSDTVSNTSQYNFALVYVASSDDDIADNKKDVKEKVKSMEENTTMNSVNSYYLDSKDLSNTELEDIFGSSDIKSGYVFISNGEVLKVLDASTDAKTFENYLSFYTINSVPEDLVQYKVAENADAYKKLVNKKKTVTMAVFGRDNCFYCNQFKAVYNTVIEEYGLDNVYYFDSTSYDEDEYQKIMDMGLTVPASCTDSGEEEKLEAGFGTPLTLFTKNGKVIDCISGYTNKATLITKLKTVGMIEEN